MAEHSALNELRSMDERNVSALLQNFSNECRIIDDLAACYVLYSQILEPLVQTDSQRLAQGFICGICRKHLLLGSLSLLRRHAAMMYRETRSALEAAGISHAIQLDPEKLKVLLEDEPLASREQERLLKQQKRKLSKHIFKPEHIFPDEIPQMKDLDDRYRTASALGHTNMGSFVVHLAKNASGGATITTQDIQDANVRSDFLRHFNWMLISHIKILELGDLIFPAAQALDVFKKERQYIVEKMARFYFKNEENPPSS